MVDAKSLPEWTRGAVPRQEMLAEVKQSIAVVFFSVVPIATVMAALFHLFAPDGKGTIAMMIAFGTFGGLIASLLIGGRLGKQAAERVKARRVLDRLTEQGEVTLGAEIVGVAYTDQVWRNSMGDDSWDHGALHLGMERLTFVGLGSRFSLRPDQILNLEIRRTEHSQGGPKARLYLTWCDGQQTGVVSLELPYCHSTRRRVEQIDSLRERIDRWRREPLPSIDRSPLVPPLRVERPKPYTNPYTKIGLTAKVLGGLTAFSLALVIEIGLMLILIHFHQDRYGGYVGPLMLPFFVFWLYISMKIEKRLPETLRYREKGNMEELPTFNLGDSIVEDPQNHLETRL